MKKIIYIMIMLVFLSAAFAGCTGNDTVVDNTPAEQPQSNDAPAQNSEQAADSSITIIIPHFYSGTFDSSLEDDSIAYLIKLFADNGFDVAFDRVNYNLDSPTCYEEYFSYLTQSLNKNNTLAFIPGYKKEMLAGYISLADLSEVIKDSSSNYKEYTENNAIISANNDTMIISSLSSLENLSAVFISNGIRGDYNKSIDTSDQYLGFVNWAQKQNESLRPSVILTFHDNINTRTNILYDIFLPQQGYIPLGNYLGQPYSLCVDEKRPENVYDTTTLSFYSSMMKNIETVSDQSKIVMKHENNANKNFSDYSSVVMPIGEMSFYAGIADYNFYPPNYTMEILNPDMQLNPSYKNTYLAAAEGTDQTQAIKLLDWIYGDIGNYITVKYGQAGVNYSFNDYYHLFLTDAGKEYVLHNPISDLINNIEFDSQLTALPANYLQEINTIEYVKNDHLYKQYQNYQTLITVNNYVYDSVNRFTRRWESTVRILEFMAEKKVKSAEFKVDFDNIDDLIAEIAK